MKKISVILILIVIFINVFSFIVANESNDEDAIFRSDAAASDVADDKNNSKSKSDVEEKNLTPASKKIIDNSSKKERKIAEYTDKYNDATYAYVAYVLDLIQWYSIPVCIIGIAIGAFNFYIIGEKKLDKREKGYSYIMAFLCGLAFFQALPLIFALLVAGR